MKLRFLLMGLFFTMSLVVCFLAIPRYSEYFTMRNSIRWNRVSINDSHRLIQDLEQQAANARGGTPPRTLHHIVNYINQHEDVEIVEIRGFDLRAGSVEILGNITSLADTSLSDGFEITVASRDVIQLVRILDSGNLVFHSAEFMFDTGVAILLVRAGGGLFG